MGMVAGGHFPCPRPGLCLGRGTLASPDLAKVVAIHRTDKIQKAAGAGDPPWARFRDFSSGPQGLLDVLRAQQTPRQNCPTMARRPKDR